MTITNKLAAQPKILFLADSIGAFVTATFLFLILKFFSGFIGMPPKILTLLTVIAAFFFIYSISCFLFLKNNWIPFIRGISIANLLYCVLTMGLVIAHYNKLTILGVAYFIGEMIIVCGLVYIELKVLNKIIQITNS